MMILSAVPSVKDYFRESIGSPQRPPYNPNRTKTARMRAAALLARYIIYQGYDPESIDRHRNPLFSEQLDSLYAKASAISAVLEQLSQSEIPNDQSCTLASTVIALVKQIRNTGNPPTIRILEADLAKMEELALTVHKKSRDRSVRLSAYQSSSTGSATQAYL